MTPARKSLMRDKVAVQDAVRVLRNPETTAAAKQQATQTIALTVLKGTGHGATDDTPKLVANLTAALLEHQGSVALSGIDAAIANVAIHHPALKDVPKADIESIPIKVKERLDRLVI
jgi:hypothetical protein